ncbi:aminopeptidase [Micromonospora sp. NPDC048830]|uniref:aminopeptidase n=1 Tax=Micromonospora sp. NPDC048830 TaxID=3364257 RepID=UPI003719DFEB
MLPEQTLATVLDQCLGVSKTEEVVLLIDDETDTDVIEGLVRGLDDRGCIPVVTRMPRYEVPGSEPPAAVARILDGSSAAIELTSTFIGSSRARQNATAHGSRYLCMPGVVADTFRIGGPLDVDFDELRAVTEALSAAWERADIYRLTTPAGTDLSGSVRGRKGRALFGIAREPGSYMCPPDVESGTAPVEGSTSGVVVIDGDFLFMGPGPVTEPVVLHIKNGEFNAAEGDESARLLEMMRRCGDPRMSNLAEVSMGLNPNGRVCGVPMETESTLGSAHIAFGNSIAYGGSVDAVAHLDCVMQHATLELDGRPVLADGELVLNRHRVDAKHPGYPSGG